MYRNIGTGQRVAPREAKREIIRGYPKQYYWASFELFAGYVEP